MLYDRSNAVFDSSLRKLMPWCICDLHKLQAQRLQWALSFCGGKRTRQFRLAKRLPALLQRRYPRSSCILAVHLAYCFLLFKGRRPGVRSQKSKRRDGSCAPADVRHSNVCATTATYKIGCTSRVVSSKAAGCSQRSCACHGPHRSSQPTVFHGDFPPQAHSAQSCVMYKDNDVSVEPCSAQHACTSA